MFKLTIEIPGLDGLRKKAADPEKELLAQPWAEAMEAIGVIGQNLAIQAAPPSKSGRTVSLMYHKVQSRPMPMWVRIGTKATTPAPGGGRRRMKHGRWSYPYSYPARLNWDPKSRYVKWFTHAMDRTVEMAHEILDRAARKIEENWVK